MSVNALVYVTPDTLDCFPNPCLNNATCLYVGGDLDRDCLCLEGFLGPLCQYPGTTTTG